MDTDNKLHAINTSDLLRVFCRMAIAKTSQASKIVLGFLPELAETDFYTTIKGLAKESPGDYGVDAAEFFFQLGRTGTCSQLCSEQFNWGVNEIQLLPLMEKLLKKDGTLDFDAHRLVRIRKYDEEQKNRVLAFKCLDLMGFKVDPADDTEPDLPFEDTQQIEQTILDITGESVEFGCVITYGTGRDRYRNVVVRLDGILAVDTTPVTELEKIFVVVRANGEKRSVCHHKDCPEENRHCVCFNPRPDTGCSLGYKKIGCPYLGFSAVDPEEAVAADPEELPIDVPKDIDPAHESAITKGRKARRELPHA